MTKQANNTIDLITLHMYIFITAATRMSKSGPQSLLQEVLYYIIFGVLTACTSVHAKHL